MPRGRKPDLKRNALVRRLRDKGLTWSAIGARLGVTRQCAQYLGSGASRRRVFPVRCRKCGADLNTVAALPRHDHTALCLPCLAKSPKAKFADALLAHRLAAGLSLTELTQKAGVP